MSQALSSSIVSNIREEAALFDSKDRLLIFSSKADFQSPLIMEAGDLFYEKWKQSEGPLPLDSFFPISANFTAQQKMAMEDSMSMVLREKYEDFGESDLYLVLGFLKWDGNALAPSLLIPVDADVSKKTLSLANRQPIENVILRERLKDKIALPKAEDAITNSKFSILQYFSLFEKAIAGERNWKFTRHGLCLGFFHTSRLLFKKRYEIGWSDKKIETNAAIQPFLSGDGYDVTESLFENDAFDHVYSPADHHFLYQTDSHTTKVVMDALDDRAPAYAIQALPGTEKMKVAANIVAESVAKKKKVLVVTRRAVSANAFKNAWKPPFRTFAAADRAVLEAEVRKFRKEYLEYYETVNNPIQPSGVLLADLLKEFITAKAPKHKFPESIFQGVNELNYTDYLALKADLEKISDLYFNKKGFEVRQAFQSVKVPGLSAEKKADISNELKLAAENVSKLDSTIKLLENAGLFPTGIFLSSLSDILELIQDNFDQDTPDFEDWELRSSNWAAYKDTLLELSEAGDKWVRYRRQTSEIYTDEAVDTNVLAARDEFAESQKATLKGLSDRYRSSKKQLLQVIRNPKDITSDIQLLDLIDTLLELQENKKAYKESAVLGNHLLGKDWQYERSNWVELHKKIQYVFEFRKKYEDNPRLELLLQILEQWHNIKQILADFDTISDSVKNLQKSIRQISKDMKLETPLDSLDINKWLNTIKSWSENWDNLDIHLQLTALFNEMESYNCPGLLSFVEDTANVNKDIVQAFVHHWSGAQIQAATRSCPDLFSLNPKARYKKNSAYRELLEKFSNANFKELHDSVEQNPELLTVVNVNGALALPSDKKFDLTIILDADCITVVESLPSILSSTKAIFIGDPHNPSPEMLPFDAYQENPLKHTPFFVESILSSILRQGVPTRELWLSSQYVDASLIGFANDRIYNNSIKQFPAPKRDQFKGIRFKTVMDKVMTIAQAAIRHAEKNPSQTLGIIAFHQSTCHEIEAAIRAMLTAGSGAARFFDQQNQDIRYFIKTPERAIDRFRDVVFVCAEAENTSGLANDRKISVCSTLAKVETRVFISESDMSKKGTSRTSLFWEWISYLQEKNYTIKGEGHPTESAIKPQVLSALEKENIQIEESFNRGGISIGPVVVDANNPNRFLALIEDDCTVVRFCDSVEDKTCIRPVLLKKLGWKVLHLWLPFWYMTNADEVGHMIATIAIEQSVAPPPEAESDTEDDEDVAEKMAGEGTAVVPYTVQHPKIEGTPHDKPIAELPAAALITQLKFYVDHEAPIHEEILKLRVLELHHVDRAGPMLQKALTDAINQGLQKKRFVKTGPFYYSLTPMEVQPRDRSSRPDFERKLAFVSPEERALMPQSLNEHNLKQALGLLE